MLMQKSPLTMLGTLSRCWLFTYQTPAQSVVPLLPPELEPVQRRNYAFWNVVVCQVQNMHPKILRGAAGITYWHIAYRLYVRFKARSGETIEGLYFMRSDCDNRLLTVFGNLFTDFKFNLASVRVQQDSKSTQIDVAAPGGDAHVKLSNSPPTLPEYSAFTSLAEAEQFLKYKPNGISISTSGQASVVHIVRDEKAWRSKLVVLQEARWAFFDDKNVKPEICYEVGRINYQWNRAQTYGC